MHQKRPGILPYLRETEVDGRKNTCPFLCPLTRCENGMNVHTNTMRVLNARRTVLELMLSDHPSDCLVCAKSGSCELQAVAIKLGIREIPFPRYANRIQG